MKRFFIIGIIIALGIWAADNYTLGENQRDERRSAMFFIEINGSPPELPESSSEKVLLNDRYGNVVHVTGEVTWREFLQHHEIGTTKINSSHYCVNINKTKCGEGILALNGEESDANIVIQQGDKLVLLLDENPIEKMEKYNSRQLPKRFKQIASTGERA